MVASMIDKPPAKPAIGAIITGGLIALLGFAAATAQGMATVPSKVSAIVAMAGIIFGCALAVVGLASRWSPRLRRPARTCNYVMLILLVVAFLVNWILSQRDSSLAQ